ncbi:protein PARALOG OF AIPP2-like [Phragmites australis]|uniref:protein PARALOG OF AIPP2-like n=1 Tax=Phragmites australis TaxID=29695 RepID=UPI002D7A32F7|nr:protein PARALOG OF AIPP2-like [Phragmites australis]
MKNRRQSSGTYFGPRLNMLSRLRMAHVSSPKKPRKHNSRFRSQRMKRILEEVKKSQIGHMRNRKDIGVTNHAHVLSGKLCSSKMTSEKICKSNYNVRDQLDNFVSQETRPNVPKRGNVEHSKTITMNENLASLAKSAGTSNHSPAMSKHMDQALTSKVNNHSIPSLKDIKHSKYSGFVNVPSSEKLDRATTVRPTYNSNEMLRPLELSDQSRMKQGFIQYSNSSKRSISLSNHLKAMPGLVHNTKGRSNLDQRSAELMHNTDGPDGCNGRTNDGKYKMRMNEPLPLEKTEIHDDIDHKMMKKRRKYIETNEEGQDDSGDQSHESDEDDTTRLPSPDASLKDCHAKVSKSFVSNCVEQQCDCCSKPIDEPVWSGILKIGSKEYISLTGHLSTKSGERVWNLSRSLRRVVEVTKVCRSEIWPKKWEASRPTGDNIGLYLFPYKMRPDKYLDQLVKEVMENDLALRAAMDESEMLIFPSSLLPKRYQTFQTKHYLWGVFKPLEVEGKQGDESRHKERTAEATAVVANATTSVPAEAPAVATNAPAVHTEAPAIPTKAHTVPANHGLMDSSMGAPPGRVVSFVVRQTPRVEQLIQEMEREGALVVAMQGEMISAGSWAGNVAAAMQ